jgi:hypothetical protein
MPGRTPIEFMPAGRPVRDPVTKLGGQPVWLAAPQWPLSHDLGVPMWFVAQFALPARAGRPRLAYLFMTDAAGFVEAAAEREAGENAVVIQPDGRVPVLHPRDRPAPAPIRVTALATGPTVGPDHVAVENPAPPEKYGPWQFLGGEPNWLQGDDSIGPGWELIAQLDAMSLPLTVNFGDDGMGYAFVSPDGDEGRFLWQCH